MYVCPVSLQDDVELHSPAATVDLLSPKLSVVVVV